MMLAASPAARLRRTARPALVAASLGLVSFVLAACQEGARRPACDPRCAPDDRPYCTSSASQGAQAAALVAQLSSTDPTKFDEVARRLACLGERAVPPLLEALQSPDPTTRAHAALILGVMLDRRTLPELARVAEADEDQNVRCEAGRALVGMGDPRGFDPLIDGLASTDARRRMRCIDTLFETTGRRLGYEADGPPDERALAVSRWRRWRERQETGLAPPSAPPATPDAAATDAEGEGAPSKTLPNAPTPRR